MPSPVNPDLIDAIYSAAVGTTPWVSFLEALLLRIGASKGTLLLVGPSEVGAVCWYGWTDEDMRLYERVYAAEDPWRIAALKLQDGDVLTDFEFCSRRKMEASVAFRELYMPRGCVHGMGGCILTTQAGQSFIAACRTQEEGPFGECEKAVLRPLMSHLRRAALLHGELGSLRRQLAIFTGHIEQYPYAFLIADAQRRVIYANSAAREIASTRDAISIEGGRFIAVSRSLDAVLSQAVTKIATAPGGPPRRLEIPGDSGSSYRLLLLPVAGSDVTPLGVSIPAVGILIASDSLVEPDGAVLRELFALTPTETRIATALVLGQSTEEIARRLNTSLQTVRTHIKRILSKTSTTRQGQLISLVLRNIPLRRR